MNIHEEMFYAPMRFGWIVPFPTTSLPDVVVEALEDGDYLPLEIQSLLNACEGRDVSAFRYDELAQEAFFRGVEGFLGVAETPVMKPTGENAHSFSWGHYRSKMFFAPTMDELVRKSLEWVEASR